MYGLAVPLSGDSVITYIMERPKWRFSAGYSLFRRVLGRAFNRNGLLTKVDLD